MSASSPRIVSLLPAATEIACALGLEGNLIGRSHECDWPGCVPPLPALTRPRFSASGTTRQIHDAVRLVSLTEQGGSTSLFTLDVSALAALNPDLVLTQATCDVCAVSTDEVNNAVRLSGRAARIVTLSAMSLDGLWRDVLRIGEAAAVLPRARELVARLKARCQSVACRTKGLRQRNGTRPRVAVLDWLDPPMAAGHWVPELIALAEGDDCLGRTGQHSHWIDWDTIRGADPDVVILAPCGLELERIVAEAASPGIWSVLHGLRATRQGQLWAIDGQQLMNRPGPRLVDSLEAVVAILVPGQFRFESTPSLIRQLHVPRPA